MALIFSSFSWSAVQTTMRNENEMNKEKEKVALNRQNGWNNGKDFRRIFDIDICSWGGLHVA